MLQDVFGYYYLNFEDSFNSLLLNLQQQIILTNFMSNQQDLIVINILAKLWNDLPKDIVEADSLHLFKSKRKTLSQSLTNNCLFLVL